jgi:hypothetical protein
LGNQTSGGPPQVKALGPQECAGVTLDRIARFHSGGKAKVNGYSEEACRCKMSVEGEGVTDLLVAHQGEECRIHVAERMVRILMQNLISGSLKCGGEKDALHLRTRAQDSPIPPSLCRRQHLIMAARDASLANWPCLSDQVEKRVSF